MRLFCGIIIVSFFLVVKYGILIFLQKIRIEFNEGDIYENRRKYCSKLQIQGHFI